MKILLAKLASVNYAKYFLYLGSLIVTLMLKLLIKLVSLLIIILKILYN